jgi:hypothetical protein
MSELKVNLKLYPEWVQDDIRTQLADTMEDYNRMRAELAASQAEVGRLRGIIREASSASEVYAGQTFHKCCDSWINEDHETDCPFYQWEGGAK